MSQVIQEPVPCSAAEEFLGALSPIGRYFKDQMLGKSWLFRGQGQDWYLKPSLFRKNNINHAELRLEERDTLIEFCRIVDKRGLVLPDDSQALRTDLARLADDDGGVSRNTSRLEDSAALSVMALAQHYGIPTRLLDWTLAPLIAAFFAAYDVYQKTKEELEQYTQPLVVWSFYFPAFEKQSRYSPGDYMIRSVTASSATNTNLRAQQGVFTLVSSDVSGERNGKYLPFDEILSKTYHKKDAKLRKFTLPVSQANDLLRLLEKLGITPSAIYPGYQSIVTDIKMKESLREF